MADSKSTKPQRIELSRRECPIYDFFCGDDLDQLKARFDKVLCDAWQEWPEYDLTAKDIRFHDDILYGTYGDRDRDVIVVIIERDETPEEVKERLARVRKESAAEKVREAKKKEEKEAEELAEFERLKKKFEGNA